MVTFCTVCGTSLPLADLLIKGGKELTSPDYRCPECGDFAAEEAHGKKSSDGDADLEDGSAWVIRGGAAETRSAAEALAGLAVARVAAASPAVAAPAMAAATDSSPPPYESESLEDDVVMPPDTDSMQPHLPLVPAVDEELQEDLPEDLGGLESASEDDEDLDFIERPE